MKLIIAGSRDLEISYDMIEALRYTFNIDSDHLLTQVISGGCPTGPDNTAMMYFSDDAVSGISYKEFPAKWIDHGKAAGPIRNKQMAEYGDILLLIWDGESKGSANMKKEMLALNKPIYEVILRKHNV